MQTKSLKQNIQKYCFGCHCWLDRRGSACLRKMTIKI